MFLTTLTTIFVFVFNHLNNHHCIRIWSPWLWSLYFHAITIFVPLRPSLYLYLITLTTIFVFVFDHLDNHLCICIWSPWQPSEGPLPRRTSLVQVQGNRGCEPSKERLFTFDSIIGFSKAGRKNFRGIFQLIRNSPAPKTPSGSFECFGLLFQSLIQPSEEYFLWDDKDKEGVSSHCNRHWRWNWQTWQWQIIVSTLTLILSLALTSTLTFCWHWHWKWMSLSLGYEAI